MVRRVPFHLLPGLHTPGHLGVSRFLGSSSPTKAKEVSLCSHLQPELRAPASAPLLHDNLRRGPIHPRLLSCRPVISIAPGYTTQDGCWRPPQTPPGPSELSGLSFLRRKGHYPPGPLGGAGPAQLKHDSGLSSSRLLFLLPRQEAGPEWGQDQILETECLLYS